MILTDVARPGLMISNTWPEAHRHNGATRKAVEAMLRHGYFTAMQTSEISYATERKAIGALVAAHGIAYVYDLTRLLHAHRLNLASPDAAVRKRSWRKAADCLAEAVEAGADTVALTVGTGPMAWSAHGEALYDLEDSLRRLCEEAKRYPGLHVVVEPYDDDLGKRNPLDSTSDVVGLFRLLAARGAPIHLCLDTTHLALHRETVGDALKTALPHVRVFQFCNGVTDPTHARYGQRGLHFGEPGFLDVHGMADILRTMSEMGFLSASRKPVLFCDVHKSGSEEPEHLMGYCDSLFHGACELSGC